MDKEIIDLIKPNIFNDKELQKRLMKELILKYPIKEDKIRIHISGLIWHNGKH